MQSSNDEFLETQRQKALTKWKWHNPYVAALLAFIHPIGMLLTSLPAFVIYLAAWTALWVWWPNRPLGTGIALGLLFAVYAYYDTLLKNAAIEKWKYGLPGMGKQNPKKVNPQTLLKSSRNKWRDEAKKLFDFYIASLKGLDSDEIGSALDLAKKLKEQIREKLPPGQIDIELAFLEPLSLSEDRSLPLLEFWHGHMLSTEPGEEALVGVFAICWLSLAAATFPELRVYGKEMWTELERGFPYCESFDPEMDIPERMGKFAK
jgi:hypothetical protein